MNKKLKDYLQNGVAGAFAGITLYTIPFGALELYSGYDLWETAQSRTLGAAIQLVVGPAMQFTRMAAANKLNIYDDQWARKKAIDFGFVAITQPPIYAGILGTTALLNNHTLTEYAVMLLDSIPPGFGIAAAGSFLFGGFVDRFWKKRLFRTAPTYKERTLEDKVALARI